MGALCKLIREPAWALVAILALAAAVLIAFAGGPGLWEPHEIGALDQLEAARADEPAITPEQRKRARADEDELRAARGGTIDDRADRAPCADAEPPVRLASHLIEQSRTRLGSSELALRLPLGLTGVLVVALTWLLGRTFGTARAAHLSASIALAFPALVFGSRQITGDTVSMACATLVVLAAIALIWPAARAAAWRSGLAAAALVMGLYLSYRAAGILAGVIAPLAAVAIGALAFALGWRRTTEASPRARVVVGTAVAVLAAVGATLWFVTSVFDLVPAGAADRQLFGMTLAPCVGETAALLGQWRASGNLESNFDAVVETIAFGAFPWVALAPIAVGRLGFGRDYDRRTFIGFVLFGWAAFTWLIAAVHARKVGPVHYAAFPALAVAIGDWLDRAWSRAGDDRRAPLVALFAALATLVIAKDLGAFPERLISIAVAGSTYTLPTGSPVRPIVVGFGVAFAVAVFAAVGLRALDFGPRLQRALRWAFPAAVVVSLLWSVTLGHVVIPWLSSQLSSKDTFETLRAVRNPGQPLGILGRLGPGPEHYAGGDTETLASRTELAAFLARPERVFALVPVGDHCAIHAAANAQPGLRYVVLDDRNSKHLLLSNQLESGERDRNRLARILVRERPTDIGTPVSVDFDGKLELIGVKMPESVDRGGSFDMTLTFHVKQPIRRNWKVFVHFDGAGQRFHGDHDPAELFCPTTQWHAGDYVVDTVTVDAGSLTYPKGEYTAWAGLFVGGAGDYTNMKVTTKGADSADRFPIGRVRLR